MSRSLILAAALQFGVLVAPAAATVLEVEATANVFGAGHTVPAPPESTGTGVLPPSHSFSLPSPLTLRFNSVTGLVSCCDDLLDLANGPDGSAFGSGTTDILSVGGISGIVHGSRTMFLVGVFLSDDEPADPAPPRLDFTGFVFGELFPALNQVFFVGDGLSGTGSGVQQVFHVPAGATRFFMGFADAPEFGDPTSLPGHYDDNLGSLTADFVIATEPSTAATRSSWGRLKIVYR